MRGGVCGLACSLRCVVVAVAVLNPTEGHQAGLRVACWMLSSASGHGSKISLGIIHFLGLFLLFLLHFLTENCLVLLYHILVLMWRIHQWGKFLSQHLFRGMTDCVGKMNYVK